MPVYPGDPFPKFEPAASLAKNSVNLTRMTHGSHTGTHMDAPVHFIPDGIRIDPIPVISLVGRSGRFGFLRKANWIWHRCGRSENEIRNCEIEGDFLLCYTGSRDYWGDPDTNLRYDWMGPSIS